MDVQGALNRLGGNVSMYARVLASYRDELAALPDQFESLLASSHFDGAAQRMHTIKGLSATVGAQPMAEAAKSLETALKSVTNTIHAQELTRALRAEVAATLARVTQVAAHFSSSAEVPKPAELSPSADNTALCADLQELQTLLKKSDLHALEVLGRLEHATFLQTNAAAAGTLKELQDAMNEFDFPRATQLTASLLEIA
jgi:HPt (histidine-containing phosphotransfer) domain-containing protein